MSLGFMREPYFLLSLLLFTSASIFSCADGLNFAADKGREDSTDEEGTELVDEPVMVGGAYLTCNYKDERSEDRPDDDGVYRVGCRVSSKMNRYTLPMSRYNSQWVLMDQERNEVLDYKLAENNLSGKPSDEDLKYWHLVYEFPDKKFRQYNLEVSVKNGRDKHVFYNKEMNRFNEDIDAGDSQMRFGLIQPDFEAHWENQQQTQTVPLPEKDNDLEVWMAVLGGLSALNQQSMQNQQQTRPQQQSTQYSNQRYTPNRYCKKKYVGVSSNSQSTSSGSGTTGSVSQNNSATQAGTQSSAQGAGGTTSNSGATNATSGSSNQTSAQLTQGSSSYYGASSPWEKRGGDTKFDEILDAAVREFTPVDCEQNVNAVNRYSSYVGARPANLPPAQKLRPRLAVRQHDMTDPDSCLIDRYIYSAPTKCLGMLSVRYDHIQQKPSYKIVFVRVRDENLRVPRPTLKQIERTLQTHRCER